MFYESGCCGQVVVGDLPEGVQKRLEGVPGEWLEFERSSGAIVVRLCQPSAAPCLPSVTGELVRMIAEVPESLHSVIRGGDLYFHTEDTRQLVRLRVEPGGEVRISWAHADYARASRRLYGEDHGPLVDPRLQRLRGCVSFRSGSAAQAGIELQNFADTYEGLYPEGEFNIVTDEQSDAVQLTMSGMNVDVSLLVERLRQFAAPGSLSGCIDVTSFAADRPEQYARFVFEKGTIWMQRPVLWREAEAVAT